MKQYKLLKDLPFAKAGETLGVHRGGINDYITLYRDEEEIHQFKVGKNVSEMFDDWFEEIQEFKIPKGFEDEYYTINFDSRDGYLKAYKVAKEYRISENEYYALLERDLEVGLAFKTKEETEKHLAYLKAKQIIKQDANGFKPDWKDIKQTKYCGAWDFEYKELDYFITNYQKGASIYFKSASDIIKSFKNHPKEWKIYLGVEDEED